MAQEYPGQEYQSGRRRLSATPDDDGSADRPAGRYAPAWRDSGVRRTRRAANWTAAALIAGVAATSGYFVHAAANSPVGAASGTTGVTQQTVAGHGHKPSLTHSVVTSSGSGVTVGGSGSGGSGSGGSGSGGSGGGSPATWRDN